MKATNKPRKAVADPQIVAEELAQLGVPSTPSFVDIVKFDAAYPEHTRLWDRLVDAVAAADRANPAFKDPSRLTMAERAALADRLQAALPARLQRAFIDYSDAFGYDLNHAEEAAYLLGVQVGLRIRKVGA